MKTTRALRLFIFFIYASINYVSAQPPGWLPGSSYAVKYLYIDSLKRGEIKGITLQELAKWARDNGDAHLGILCTVRMYEDSINSLTLEQLAELENKAKGLPLIQAEVKQLYGDFYKQRLHKNSWALEYYLNALQTYKDLSPDKFPAKRRYLYALAGSYYDYRDYATALIYFKKAMEAQGYPPDEEVKTTANTIGLCYLHLKKYDSAEFHLLQTYKNIIKQNDSEWIWIMGQNLGLTYYFEKKFDQAIPLLQSNLTNPRFVTGNPGSIVSAAELLADIFLQEQKINLAENYINYALTIYRSRVPAQDKNYDIEKKMFWLLHRLYVIKNDMGSASKYADSAMIASDSAHAQEISFNQTSAGERAEFAQRKSELDQLQHEQHADRIIRNSLALIIVLVTLICILLINRQRLKQKKLVAEKKNAEADLNAAALQLDSFRNTVQEKNLLLESFSTELEKVRQGQQEQTDNELISQLERSIILTDEQWENFRVLFEKVHKGFFAALKKKMPDLTQAEIRLMALTKLKLTSKEMAAMLGISVNSIRTYRHRLRKKLDVENDDLMEGLLDDI